MRPLPAAALAAVATLLAACEHPVPFGGGTIPDAGPATPPPVRLTFNALRDETPAWLPDGSGLLYAFEAQTGGPPPYDQCLGLLPPDGGTRRETRCSTIDPGQDSTQVLRDPAPAPDGRLAWVEMHFPSSMGAILVGDRNPASTGTVVRPLPYLAPSGNAHATATHLAWLDPGTLIYVGADRQIRQPCPLCPVDSLIIGREIALLALDPAGPVTAIVPGTATATAVAPDPSGQAIVYTLAGDSRVYRQVLATGAIVVLHDFGGLGIARDPSLQDSTLVAVVGGLVSVTVDPALGTYQTDRGGVLYRVHLPTGLATPVDLPGHLVRRPALAPHQPRVAVEAYDPLASNPAGDLFLVDLP